VSRPLAPANPLQALIQQAASAPAETGNTARYRRRFASAGTGQVIVADVSGSMADLAWGGKRKIEVLREALAGAPPARLIAFSSSPSEIASSAELPEPGGGTAMHRALDAASAIRPERTLVISDGQPDDEGLALASAERLSGAIDVLYIGPDGDYAAIAFMRALARAGAGRYASHDLRRAGAMLLGQTIRGLLPGGSR